MPSPSAMTGSTRISAPKTARSSAAPSPKKDWMKPSKPTSSTNSAVHNWNQVCNGGITLGALAIADEEHDRAEYLVKQSIDSIQLAMASYAPEGGWAEGPGYWQYATSYNVYYLAALQSALGTDFGLSSLPGFAHAGDFRIYFQ